MGTFPNKATQFGQPGHPGGRTKGSLVGRKRAKELRRIAAEAEAAAGIAPPKFADALSFLQSLYQNESLPLETRIKAASLCQSFERPALSAIAVKDVTPRDPAAVEKRIEELLKIGMSNAPKLLEG